MKSAKKVILFDLGGVIVNVDITQAITTLAQKLNKNKKEIELALFSNGLKERFDTGAITPSQFFSIFKSKIKVGDIKFEEFVSIYSSIFTLKEDNANLIKKLASTYPLYILSNTDPLHWEYISKTFREIISLFKGYHLSFLIGHRKPSETYFRLFLENYHYCPQDCIFIDDSPENIEVASKLNFNTILFKTDTSLEGELKRFILL